jgi:hypothetical protein
MDLFIGALTNSDKSLNNNKLYKNLSGDNCSSFFVFKRYLYKNDFIMKKIIRLTEGDLRNVIKKSVEKMIKEGWNNDRFEYDHFSDEGNGGAEEYGANIAELINGLGNDPDSIMAVAEEAAQHMDKENVLKPFIQGLIAVYKSGENLLNPSPQDIYDKYGIVRK